VLVTGWEVKGLLGGHSRLGTTTFFSIVDEVTAWAIWAETNCMECPAELSLVFGVTGECTEVLATMGELALVSIFAVTIFLEWSAEFCLVTGTVSGSIATLHRFGLCPLQAPVHARGFHGG